MPELPLDAPEIPWLFKPPLRKRVRADRPPAAHRFCLKHPGRLIPHHPTGRAAWGCWLCETRSDDMLKLDLLCQLGLSDIPQSRITGALLEKYLVKANYAQLQLAKQFGWIK